MGERADSLARKNVVTSLETRAMTCKLGFHMTGHLNQAVDEGRREHTLTGEK